MLRTDSEWGYYFSKQSRGWKVLEYPMDPAILQGAVLVHIAIAIYFGNWQIKKLGI